MKKLLFGNPTSATPASLGLLITRLVFGLLMLTGHGWGKLVNFANLTDSFSDPLGIGSMPTLVLAVFAEAFCALLVSIGLLTRAATLPLIATMGAAAFVHHAADPLFMAAAQNGSKEPALLFLAAFAAILVAGPGKFSLDHLIRKS